MIFVRKTNPTFVTGRITASRSVECDAADVAMQLDEAMTPQIVQLPQLYTSFILLDIKKNVLRLYICTIWDSRNSVRSWHQQCVSHSGICAEKSLNDRVYHCSSPDPVIVCRIIRLTYELSISWIYVLRKMK